MKLVLRAAALSLGALGACQSAPRPLVVDKPDATLAATFAQVSNVVELRDGRIAFADPRDSLFLFADLTNGKVDTIGIHVTQLASGDSAPAKHKLPGKVFRFPGDTIALVDYAIQRTTLWNEQGEYLGTLPLEAVAGPSQPVAFDSVGYGYKEDYRAVMGGLEPGSKIRVDSVGVLRYGRATLASDTVARLKIPDYGEGLFGEERKVVPMVFAGRDVFGVLGDGSIWVARAATNSVDWRTPAGKWEKGEHRSYSKIPVTAADKEGFMASLYRSGLPRGITIEYPFADFKPPFSTGLARPTGELWLQRSRSVDDSLPVYDIVGRDGKGRTPVQLPKGMSVVGFGAGGAVYAMLRVGDDRQTVARFRIGGTKGN